MLDAWNEHNQIALRHGHAPPLRKTSMGRKTAMGNTSRSRSPENPNGSMANIAGLSDPSGRVLGLMPHPERFIFGTQHPQWTRSKLPDEGQGLQLFRNAVAYFG